MNRREDMASVNTGKKLFLKFVMSTERVGLIRYISGRQEKLEEPLENSGKCVEDMDFANYQDFWLCRRKILLEKLPCKLENFQLISQALLENVLNVS